MVSQVDYLFFKLFYQFTLSESLEGDLMEGSGLNHFKIGELAKLVEMSPRTIRYYEEIGLLDSVKRIGGG